MVQFCGKFLIHSSHYHQDNYEAQHSKQNHLGPDLLDSSKPKESYSDQFFCPIQGFKIRSATQNAAAILRMRWSPRPHFTDFALRMRFTVNTVQNG